MAGVDFVKTSTGFGPGGATVEDVGLRKVVGPRWVKASGGPRLRVHAPNGEAGATRTERAGIKIIVKELEPKQSNAGSRRVVFFLLPIIIGQPAFLASVYTSSLMR